MLDASATSTAATADLWRVVSEVTAWPQHLDTFTSVALAADSPAPGGVGARYLVRQPGLAAATYEMTEWEPGTSFTWVARCCACSWDVGPPRWSPSRPIRSPGWPPAVSSGHGGRAAR